MATVQVLKNAMVVVDGTDLTTQTRQVTLTYQTEVLDGTAMGDTNRTRVPGYKDWSIDLEFYQNYASSSVDDVLFDLVGSSTFTVSIRPTTNAQASTNPTFSGTGLLESYSPLGGTVGELLLAPVRIQAASALSRHTSST